MDYGQYYNPQKQNEKRRLQRAVASVSIALICYLAFSLFLAEPIFAFADRLCELCTGLLFKLSGYQNPAYYAKLFMQSDFFTELRSASMYAVEIGLPALCFAFASGNGASYYYDLRRGNVCEGVGEHRSSVFGNILPLSFFAVFVSMTFSSLVSMFSGGSVTEETFPESPAAIVVYYIALAVLPPLLEEFFMRGIILKTLLPHGKVFAVVMSSALFALLHGTETQIAYAFCAGIVMGIVAVETGSLGAGMLIHLINNSVVFADSYITARYPDYAAFASYATSLILLFGGIISLYFIFGKKGCFAFFGEKKAENHKVASSGLLSEGEKYKYILTPSFLVFVCFTLLISILNSIAM